MAKEYETVNIWFGEFPTRKRLNKYLEESYDDSDEELPISEFARDLGTWWYDHDFLHYQFYSKPPSLPYKLVEGQEWSESYIESVKKVCEKLDVGRPNAIILLWGDFEARPKSHIKKDDYKLVFVGSFDCKPE